MRFVPTQGRRCCARWVAGARAWRRVVAATLLAGLVPGAVARADEPFADEVTSFRPGSGAGFGQDRLPDVVLGPPQGGGLTQGALDVVSLGDGGEIVLHLGGGGACDRPGPDLTVFENAFHAGGADGPLFIEVGIVAVAGSDAATFSSFPFDPESFAGLAGRSPVFSNAENGISPLDPAVSGGDTFDLADLGLSRAEYIRITDPGATIADPGNRIPPGTSGGFDLDAVAVLHPCDVVSDVTPTPTSASLPASPTPTATATVTPPRLSGDVDGDADVDEADREAVLLELFDNDGDDVSDAALGDVVSTAAVDTNSDQRVTAADLVFSWEGRP